MTLDPAWTRAIVSVLAAYAMSQAIAAVYAWTYRGLSYSRGVVQTLAAGGVVAAMLMLAIGDSLARGIGIVGTLALIRFRTNLRDPMDMVFVFASFGAGIAAGTGNLAAGVVGTVAFLIVATMLRVTDFGAQRIHDGVLRLRVPASGDDARTADAALERLLTTECAKFSLVTIREAAQGREFEKAYQITMFAPGAEAALVAKLAAIPGATQVSLSMQEANVEL